MNWIKKITPRVALLLALPLVVIACTVSYKFNGSSINYDKVKTISIADFPIKSEYVYAPLATKFNEDLKDIFIRQTRLQLLKPNQNADLQIDGEITGYNQYNQAVSADGYSSETKLTITVNVRFVNNTNHAEDFEQQFSAFRTYDSSQLLTAVQDGLIAEMTKEITDQIFNATSVNFQQWIQHPETLDRDTLYELRNMLARYPYFQSLRLLYLKNLYILHDINFGAELRKAVLYIADRRKLFQLIEGDRFAVQSRKKGVPLTEVLKNEPSVDRTLALIDAFLSTVPEEVVGQTTFDYSMDYTTYLLEDNTTAAESEEVAPKLKGYELIDDFIEKSESEAPLCLKPLKEEAEISVTPSEEVSAAEEEDDSCFTETLAKIYVKQQRYSKALEIIKKLSLKYPKKNAYFADQIRFLEKLIINANSK